ncbi:olfactory receptor 6M1-like [Rhinatrema bivittatum]|uniref:olfactory receptor 6M1-like n=1 Tax=Rhinatrema bivittatum TaxID=194408 RepID=UPI00112725B4|nr:olfactory receptor 6M1-like [Rhinatrema bivittatum]
MDPRNKTTVTEFILQGFPIIPELEIFLFVLFLLIYVLSLTGHLLIIMLTCMDYHLHTPMYFFLTNFFFLEIVITTTVVPKMLANLLAEKKTISFLGCVVQCFFYFLVGTAELFVLSAMSFDRYVAICDPLHYSTILTWKLCHYLILGSWLGGLLSISIPTVLKLQLPFCGPNIINHFFCDSGPLIKLACSDTRLIQLLDFFLFSLVVLSSLILTIVSYINIAITILRIPCTSGRGKAFSTCAAHLTVVALGYGSTIFIYVTPSQVSSLEMNKLVCVLNVFVTPALSPFIFSLRNEKVKEALKSAIAKCLALAHR